MAYIYCLNDPITDTPKYIGCTLKTIKQRYRQHLYEKAADNNKKCNWILSLRKKGLRPTVVEVDCVPDKDVEFWEKYYISLYKSWGFDLKNTTMGGDITIAENRDFSKVPILQYSINGEFIREWKGTIDASNFYGKSPHYIKAVLRGKRNSTLGFIWRRKTPNYRLKIKPVNLFPNKKEVIQYDLDGNFIKVWDCARVAARALNLSEHTVSFAANGKCAYCGDFIWRIKIGDKVPLFVPAVNKKIDVWGMGSRIAKRVLQYDLNGVFIKEWERTSFAAKELNLCRSKISAACIGKIKTSGGYIWKYKEDINNLN